MIPEQASAEFRRLVAQSPESSLLDSVLRNADTDRAAYRFALTPSWEQTHVLTYRESERIVRSIPMSAVSNSWASEQGRVHLYARLARRAQVLIDGSTAQVGSVKMLTLTFRAADESWCSGAAVRAFCGSLRHYCRRLGYEPSYMWVMELQYPRCAAHYHIVISHAPFLPKRLLQSWWTLGFVDIRAVPAGDALKYVLKYVRKGCERDADVNPREAEKALVQGVLCRACGLRRHGATRDLSMATRSIPAWVSEQCAELGLPPECVSWYRIPSPDGLGARYGCVLCFGEHHLDFACQAGRWVIALAVPDSEHAAGDSPG